MSHRSQRNCQGRQGTATTREDRRSHSRSHDVSDCEPEGTVRTKEDGRSHSLSCDESDREPQGMVRTREDRHGHRRYHDELNHEKVGELSENGTVTAVAAGSPEGEISTQDLLRWMTPENAKGDERIERCLQTLGASFQMEPRIAK